MVCCYFSQQVQQATYAKYHQVNEQEDGQQGLESLHIVFNTLRGWRTFGDL